jgi:hypothetical protein
MVLALAGLGLLGGCAGEQLTKPTSEQQAETIARIYAPTVERQRATQAAIDVLVDMHFVLDKADVEKGLVSTRPLPGAQFFEFWRSDNVGPANAAEANLHSIRRAVDLKLSRWGEHFRVSCDVQVQRLNMPERELTSSAQAYQMFSRSTPSMQRLELGPRQEEAMQWTDLGNDTELAAEILRRIETRVRKLQEEQSL